MHLPAVDTEPFPSIGDSWQNFNSPTSKASMEQSSTALSSSGRLRRTSQGFQESNSSEGFSPATGNIASSVLYSQAQAQPPNASTMARVQSPDQTASANPLEGSKVDLAALQEKTVAREPPTAAAFLNGYHFPPKHTFAQSTKLDAVAFWKYFTTPIGFLVTIYGLNIVAWGGMLFLLLCNASPAMCYPSCNHINSLRRKWMEWDAQILNALFCVTGFGLAPWRFRDLYYLLQYRISKKELGLRRLAGIHRDWIRLPGSETLPVDIGPSNVPIKHDPTITIKLPFPETMVPEAPLTGVRAPPSDIWKLDLVIWLMIWNTLLQGCLAGLMWGMSRYDRPSWATGFFIALACIVGAVGGYIMFLEGKHIKSIEGVKVSLEDQKRLARDHEQGIWHYNNIRDEDLGSK